MKKLKICVLLVLCVTFLTACGCSKKNFTVEFDSNGGTKVQSQTIEKGDKVTKPENPTREGYTFEYWLFEGEKFDFNTEVKEDMTLVAKWSKVKEEVTEEVKTCSLKCSAGYELNESSCTCTKLSVTEVVVDKQEVELDVDGSTTISASVKPVGALNKNVTYTSSDESVATVDKNGAVTAVSPGTAVITIKSEDSGIIATVTVTVLDVYEYVATKLDSLDVSYKISVYKNGTKLTGDDLKNVEAVYNSSLKYLGRYEQSLDAIMVDKSQVDSIAKIKVNGKVYTIREMQIA